MPNFDAYDAYARKRFSMNAYYIYYERSTYDILLDSYIYY